jgi:hypothetical protein
METTHRDKLISDPSEFVRRAVAWKGNANHAKALLNDKDKNVRDAAKGRLKKLGVR